MELNWHSITEGNLGNSLICRKLKNVLLNSQWVKGGITKEMKKHTLRWMKIKSQYVKICALKQQRRWTKSEDMYLKRLTNWQMIS